MPSGVLTPGGPCRIVRRALTSATHMHTGQSQGPGMGGTEQTAGRRSKVGLPIPGGSRAQGALGDADLIASNPDSGASSPGSWRILSKTYPLMSQFPSAEQRQAIAPT